MGFFAGNTWDNKKVIAIGPSSDPQQDPNGSYFHSQWPYMTTQIFETTNFSQTRDHVYFGTYTRNSYGWPTQWVNKWTYRATNMVTLGINDGNIQQWIASGRVFIVQALVWDVWYTVPPRVENAMTEYRGGTSGNESINDSYPVWNNPGQTVYGRGTGMLRLCVSGVLSGAPISSLRFIFIENLYSTGGGGLAYYQGNPNNDRELYIDRTNLKIGSENYLFKRFFCYTDQLGGGYRVGCPSVWASGNFRSDVYEDYFTQTTSDSVIGGTIGIAPNSLPVGGGYWPGSNGIIRAVEQVQSVRGGVSEGFQVSQNADSRARIRDQWGCRMFSAMALSDYGQSLSIDNTRIMSGGTEVFGPNVYLYKSVLANVSMYFEGGRRRIQDYPMGQYYYEEVTRADVSGAMRNGFLTGLITIPSDGLQKPPSSIYTYDGICGFQNNMAMPFRLADGEEMLLFNCSSTNYRYLGTQHFQHSVSVVMRNVGGVLIMYKVTLRVNGGSDPFVGDEMVTWPRCRALVSLLG